MLTERIREQIAASPFSGEGHRKVWAGLRVAGIRTLKTRVLRLMNRDRCEDKLHGKYLGGMRTIWLTSALCWH